MALSRLLQVQSRPHLQRLGLVNRTRRWCYCTSSSSASSGEAEQHKAAAVESFSKFGCGEGKAMKSSSHLKKPILAKEHKAAVVESFVAHNHLVQLLARSVKGFIARVLAFFGSMLCFLFSVGKKLPRYMETHQGTFPKVTHVKSNVGGSWYTVKEILTKLKEKMLGNPQLQNHSTSDTSDSTVDGTASEVITTRRSDDSCEIGEVRSTVMNSELNNDNTLPSSTSSMLREYSSENMISAPGFESVQTWHKSDDAEIIKLESMVQSSTPLLNCGNNEENCINPTCHVPEESCSADSVLEASNVVKMHKNLNGHQNHQPETEKRISASLTPNAGSKAGGKHSVPIDGPQKTMGMADLLAMVVETSGEKNDSVTLNSPELLNEATGRGEKGCDLWGLLDCMEETTKEKSNLRPQRSFTPNKMDQTSLIGAIEGMQREANSLRSDNKGRNGPTNGRTTVKDTNNFKESQGNLYTGSLFELFDTNPLRKDIEGHPTRKHSEGRGIDIGASDSTKSKPSRQVLLPTSKQDIKKTPNALSAEKGADDNKVLVRFLHASTKRYYIDSQFTNCGRITRVEFHSKGGLFKTACIYFETKEGMQNALKKNGLRVGNKTLIVEAARCEDNIPSKTLIPSLIGYTDIPASLVKNPTRTVMITQLTPGINFRDIEAALAFCGSKISGFFFGSSSSVAYVELATEEAKQRALERNSITASEKLLRIFRLDAPRTTVVRISNLYYPEVEKKLEDICASFGQVKLVVVRCKEVVDVHFDPIEWPNMLMILNKLNGLLVGNSHWIAQPAPVFPPEVLHVLWKHPDERRRLKTQVDSLLQKVVDYPTEDKVRLASMTNEYYSTACE